MKRLEGKNILLADDEFSVRLAFAMMLDAAGAPVTQATNGTEALEAYQAGRFDCVVTDYSMPGMKGDALALAIKTRNPKQRVVMVSGFAESVLVNGRLPWFIDALVPKPCGMDDLLEAVVLDADREQSHSQSQ
jgi:CheY-like chemotaxis protein